MSDELTSRYRLKEILLCGWCTTDKSDEYRKGLMDALKIAEVIEPVNTVELPCKIEDKIYEPCRCGRIHVQTVKGFTVSDHVEMVNCETKNYSVREIGNTAFFTREEAERALEELRNE